MNIGFDLVSDLNLSSENQFDWEGKATSLYCIVAGNISSNLKVVVNTLSILSRYYQGVFYIPGSLEYQDSENYEIRTKEIIASCRLVRNVAVLYQHVVIIDGVAILGCNGWYGNTVDPNDEIEKQIKAYRYDDIFYLKNSIEKLQKHLDVTKIIIVTNSVPNNELYFGEGPNSVQQQIPLNLTLLADTQHKISHWLFGTYGKIVDTVINNVNYLNNPGIDRNPYWAKRINVEV